MKETVLIDLRPLSRRSPLAASLLLHCALVSLLALWPNDRSMGGSPVPVIPKRSVLVLRLRDLRDPPKKSAGSSAEARGSAAGDARASSATLRFEPPGTSSEASKAQIADLTPLPKQKRQFELSAALPTRPLKQTIIQIDVPPDVVLKQEIPLSNIVFWTPQHPVPAFRKQFVAPPLKEIPRQVAQNLPPAPQIELPNREMTVSDLKLAATLLQAERHLILPPGTTAPVRMPKPGPINQAPPIVVPDPSSVNAGALIALVESPVRPAKVIIVPPANQVASSGPSGENSHGNGRGADGQSPQAGGGAGSGNAALPSGSAGFGAGTANLALGHGGSGSAADGRGPAADGSGSGGEGIASSGTAAGPGNQPGGALSGLGSAGSGTAGSGAGASPGPDLYTEGVTRITLPKDGHFGVVVFGSSQAAPYPESVGTLSGKMIYTVYLGVGLHKKWILQYCLTQAAERAAPRGSATPIDAPWPFLIFRPDNLTGSNDYVIVHGMIDAEGRFDQLAMVFPDQFDQKDILLSSLKLWAFRPASRDREPTPVEVLLIIPTES